MINWIFENWFLAIVLSCSLGLLIIQFKQFLLLSSSQKQKLIKDIIFTLVVAAEEQLGSKKGNDKLQLVIKSFYKKYPIAKLLFPESKLIPLIEENVQKMKELILNE